MSTRRSHLKKLLQLLFSRNVYVVKMQKDPRGIDGRIVSCTDKKSILAEEYHMLQTHLCAITANKDIKTIVITSSQENEGKTITCCNLAASFAADASKRIALVDLDLRKPNIHTMMGIGRSPGISDIIRGRCRVEDALKTPAIGNLFILPAGSEESDVYEFLKLDTTKELINKLRSSFDYLIIDTPPVMPVIDSRIIGSFSDAVIFVARSEKTSKKIIKDAFSLMETAKARPMACILTDFNAPFYHYGRYLYYSYYYSGHSVR